MDLVLWRHCDAESGVPDELRPLTPRGRKDAERMAQWLAPRLPGDCRILVSPAVRAQETARALQRAFETTDELAPGASVEMVLRVAGWPDATTLVLVVGHEPTLGRVAASLLTGRAADRPIAKGGVVWIASCAHDGDASEGTLEAAASPDSI